MVEFKKMFLQRVEAQRDSQNVANTMDVAVDIPKLKKVREGIEATYSYTTQYGPRVGYLKMSGTLIISDTDANLDRIMERWQKQRTVDDMLARQMASLITYVSSVNGVLVAKALNFNPPVMPPDLKIEGAPRPNAAKEAKATKGKKKKKR
ncbi:MAG: hypothetical protein ABIH29_04080 [Candidatus Micrarchaeota archaeon]